MGRSCIHGRYEMPSVIGRATPPATGRAATRAAVDPWGLRTKCTAPWGFDDRGSVVAHAGGAPLYTPRCTVVHCGQAGPSGGRAMSVRRSHVVEPSRYGVRRRSFYSCAPSSPTSRASTRGSSLTLVMTLHLERCVHSLLYHGGLGYGRLSSTALVGVRSSM